MTPPTQLEWLEADGLGGFASGTASGLRTRRYHALLLAATHPPAGRMVLVNGLEAWAETPMGPVALTSQHYAPGVIHPDGMTRIESFTRDPWPRWRLRVNQSLAIEHEVFAVHGAPVTVVTWKPLGDAGGVTLHVRPLLSGRDFHALHRENGSFHSGAEIHEETVLWRPYDGVPAIAAQSSGTYEARPDWYRNFLYTEEEARGLDASEDLASPGVFHFDLSKGSAVLILAASGAASAAVLAESTAALNAMALRESELMRRCAFPAPLHRAGDAYLVQRGSGKTIIAGYPWFGDWGRDTFIAMRGLCLATGRLAEARDILLEWAGAVSDGMLPNRFPDHGETPEYNSVDAALWYIVVVHEFLHAAAGLDLPLTRAQRARLDEAVDAILEGYAAGTRHGIRLDSDGLLAAGAPGVQLTWMDAKVGDWVVTPRVGKPVEVQALWLNALHAASARSDRWRVIRDRGLIAFRRRFWDQTRGHLHDVVDVDHVPGTADPTLRPNQLLAAGGLPLPLLDGSMARSVVEVAEARLWTPLGLRSLAPGEPAYAPRCHGGVAQRDGAYHQGTVWPWLLGPFVEAWLRVHGATPQACQEARERFVAPLRAHVDDAGLGHVSEIADAEPPHTPRGCPFQAWSVGELIRLERLLAPQPSPTPAMAMAR